MAHPRFTQDEGLWFAGLLSMTGSLHMNRNAVILTIQSRNNWAAVDKCARIIGNPVRVHHHKVGEIHLVEIQGAALHFLFTHPWVWDHLLSDRRDEYVNYFRRGQELGFRLKKGRSGKENSHHAKKVEDVA